MTVEHPRRIRSFVRRPGRITIGQKRALDQLLPRFGVPFGDCPLDFAALFGRSAPLVVDIGFGDGDALLSAAATFPDIDYLGIEVHEPGVGHLLTLIERADVQNIRIIQHDAVDVLDAMIPDSGCAAVNLFFPDPWPKKRHHKRRIVQPGFLHSVARVLQPAGLFHFATDWADYAEQAPTTIGECGLFELQDAAALEDEPLAYRAPTKFEARGRRLGHQIVDLYYGKSAGE